MVEANEGWESTYLNRVELLKSLLGIDESTFALKILILGDEKVGKTTYLSSLMNREFSTNYIPTVGAEFSSYEWKEENLKVNLSICDVAGQSSFRNMRNSYFHGASGAFLCFDLSRKETFENLGSWIDEYYTFIHGSIYGFRPIVIIGCKNDLKHAVDEKNIIKYCKQLKNKYDFPYPIDYVSTSALDPTSILPGINSLIITTLLDLQKDIK